MPDSLKNMLSSVDWSKMMTSSDAKNALIGSALGGLMLGGAGLMQKRDPEESRFAPVGDALLGALLGGVAGYGIPKGLSLFRDAGHLAPDNDRIKSNYLGWGLTGAGAGAGLVTIPAMLRANKRLQGKADSSYLAGQTGAAEELARARDMARRHPGVGSVVQQSLDDMAHYDPKLYKSRIRVLEASMNAAKARGDTVRAKFLSDRIAKMTNGRTQALHGRLPLFRGGLMDIVREVGKEGPAAEIDAKKDILPKVLPKTREWFRNFTNGGKHYGEVFRNGRNVGTLSRMLRRAGKYGAIGAGGLMLLHKLLGPSAQNNFKN